MDGNAYLNPDSIRSQCDAAIQKLLKDNAATYTVEKSLNTFVGNGQIASTAFQALKQQISDYKTVLQAMRTANQSDMEDFLMLKLRVGNQELNGAVILEQKESALSAKKSDEKKAEEYRKKARNEKILSLRLYYSNKAASYKVMAEADQKLYNAWQEKENRYNEIEGCTSGLFTNGAAMRAAAENALNSIRGAFQNGAYVPDMNAAWRGEISSCYINRVMTRNADGTVNVNWTEVKKILKKDAEQITEEEYNALALLYLNMGEEDMGQFLAYMMGNRKDYTIQVKMVVKNDFSVWIPEHEKLEQLINRVESVSQKELSLLQSSRKDGKNEEALKYEMQRGVILQRLTLLSVINGVVRFEGEYQVDYPTFSVIKNKDGDLIFSFLENKGMTKQSQVYELLESTITVHSTKNGTSIDDKIIDDIKYTFNCRFGDYSLENYVADKAKEQIVESTLGSLVGNGLISGFGLEFWSNQQEAEKNRKFIEEQFDAIYAGEVYSDYDCSASFVDYDIGYGDEHKIFVYEGEKTADKINLLNSNLDNANEIKKELATLLKKAFPPNGLTMEIVLTRPEEVFQFAEGLPEELRAFYDEIAGNKIKEVGEKR